MISKLDKIFVACKENEQDPDTGKPVSHIRVDDYAESCMFDLLRDIKGSGSTFDNAAMKWGRDHEPAAFVCANATFADEFSKCGFFVHRDLHYVGASPDGLSDARVLEIKCPYSIRSKRPSKADVKRYYTYYKTQLTVQMGVCRKKKTVLFIYTPEGFAFEEFAIDKPYWEELKSYCTYFYTNVLKHAVRRDNFTYYK